MNIIRVFPRRTKATPTDSMAFIGDPPLFIPKAEKVMVSVAFTYDKPEAERLAEAWEQVTGLPVEIGGPAYGKPSGDFVPGMFLKQGYTITSRGCPNKCWFCSVWRREPSVREQNPVPKGWNILDDNLLACSELHIKNVFSMLRYQKEPATFTGGLEAKLLKPWHIEEMLKTRIDQMFFSYDTPDDYDPLEKASKMLGLAGFSNSKLRCYVLIGYPNDTILKAEKRLNDVLKLNMMPMAMLYRNEAGKTDATWRKFQREWARPAIIRTKIKEAT